MSQEVLRIDGRWVNAGGGNRAKPSPLPSTEIALNG